MIRIGLLLFAILCPTIDPPGELDFYEEPDPIRLTIIAPLRVVQEDRSLEAAEYHDVRIVVGSEQAEDTLEAELRVRGNFRRQAENCEWPPLKLKVRKHDVGSEALGEHRKFKLVTNCQGENYLMREYMVYKMYAQMTDCSFQVRIVDLTLRDEEGLIPDSRQRGFMIEDKDELADRMGFRVMEGGEVMPDRLEVRERARLSLFQYMVGNRDWDVFFEKNIDVFDHAGKPVAIPFDFDFSGCVGVPYSGLDGYELRQWREMCWDAELQEAIRLEFEALVPVWTAMIEECQYLDRNDQREMLSYFRPFFKLVEKPDKWAKEFGSSCS